MRSTRGLSLVLLICAPTLVAPGPSHSADVQTNVIRVEYDPPKSPTHQPLYEMVKERRVLEKLREVFAPFQLPLDLTFKMTGCDGQSNAWYARPALTICYEYLDEIRRDMPKECARRCAATNPAA